MSRFIATFHTHLSAMLTAQALETAGAAPRMMPVPRRLSSSCGTCVRYEAADPCLAQLDRDWEAVYRCTEDGYDLVAAAEEN